MTTYRRQRRSRLSSEDRFTTSEVALGTGLTQRNVLYLCTDKLIPVVQGGGSQGKHREIDFEGLARSAVISAFHDAGIEIYLAARLVDAIGDETSFHRLVNLKGFLTEPNSEVMASLRDQELDAENAYYLHKIVRSRSGAYKLYRAFPFDRLIEIVDRRVVFLNHLIPDKEKKDLAPSLKPTALYMVANWEKGSKTVELYEAPNFQGEELPEPWARARRNFKGMVRINVSLVLRDALDAIANSRANFGMP